MKKLILLLYQDTKKRPRLLLLVLTLALAGAQFDALAQTPIKGKVTDEAGSGMPGVNILVKGTTTGTTTDSNGDYTISIDNPSQATLVISFIGYATQEILVGERSTIDVSLLPSLESLSEVVVVGYGTQKKSDVTGALVSVNSQSLREVPTANLQQALQGRAAGVEVQRVGTAPGAGTQIRIRGDRSLIGTNEPFLVLDGIPYEGNLSDINPDEIESVNVLKDASATAIYGSRGADGVILIQTKRGKAGETRLNVDSYIGVTTVARKYDLFNGEEYAAMRDASGWPNGYRAEEVQGLAIGRNTDWQDLMYEDGYITNHNIGVTGGTEKSQFALGGGYYKETTVLPGQDFERFSVKATVDTKIGQKLKLGFNSMNSVSITNGSQFLNQQPNTPGAFGGSILYNILSGSPLMPAYTDDGEIFQRPAGNNDDAAANYSPLYLKNNNNDWVDKVRRLRTFNSLYAEYEIIDGLRYRFNLGLDYSQSNFAQFQGKDSYFRVNNLFNRARVRNGEQYSWTAENIITYDKTIKDKHRINFTGLYSAQRNRTWATQVHQEDITADFVEFYNMGLANPDAQTVLSGDEETRGILSYMARLNYAFDDRYMLTLTYRRDGSSVLANKWHEYPAVALGWNVMNESFLKNINQISNLKLRFGYGETSNQSVTAYTTLGGVSNNYQGVPIKYNYGTATQVSGFLPIRIPDTTLDWEYTQTVNIGLDFGLFNDRVTGTLEWYKATTTDILFSRSMPITSGYADPFITNLGKMENKGIELSISSTNVRSGGFVWNTDFNWFYNRNTLLEIAPGVQRDINNGLHVGYPVNAVYDYKKLGVWQLDQTAEAATFGQLPGQLHLADLSGPEGTPDGVINELDRSVIGDQQAKWQAGMTNRFSYKGIELSIVAFMRYGGTLLSYLHAPNGAYLTNLNGQRNGLDVDYWTPTNPTNEFPAPSASLPGGAASAWSTLAYYDATFIKIRSISLGYTIPSFITDKVKANSVRVYVTAQNPFLLYCPYVRDHNGLDPEPTGMGQTGIVSTAGTYRTQGPNQNLVISASTPPTRSFLFGVNISF
jgi:TonB-linked SusC/RagA family outer membrane protein